MNDDSCYENYPLRIALLSNLVSIAIYAIGAFIIYQIGWIWLLLYIAYVLWLEIKLLRKSCVNCCYYGKVCAFGKGKISKILFKQGNPQEFGKKKVTWVDMIPDFLVSLIPIVAAIVLLIIDFSWLLLVLLILLVLFTFTGNGFVRGSLACKYCRQREIGCPAVQLFGGENMV